MATLNQWTLPLSASNPNPFFLRFLTPELDGRLYYTKYIVDVIGELSVGSKNNNVREWIIPKNMFAPQIPPAVSGDPRGITSGPDKTVWTALESGHRLPHLDQGSGILTSYGDDHGAFGSTHYNHYPISYPRDVMTDRNDNIWYIGRGSAGFYHSKGPLIGRLKADRNSADIWELPELNANLSDLWVRDDGGEVWFTLYCDNSVAGTLPFLGRLQPLKNRITIWMSHYIPPDITGAFGIATDSPGDPANIWFTFFERGTSDTGTYRLELSTGTFYHYASNPKNSNPQQIALADNGEAWISDWSGKLSTVQKQIYCNKADFPQKILRIRPRNMEVRKMQAMVNPEVHTIVPVQQNVVPVKSACVTDYLMPSGLDHPNGIAVNDAPENPTIYISQEVGNIIGQLIL